MSTPDLHLTTCLLLNDDGRIISTREPQALRGPLFTLVRSATSCAWAVRADVPTHLADELDRLARDEPLTLDLRVTPVHADRYVAILGERIEPIHQAGGPAFQVPDSLAPAPGRALVAAARWLHSHFLGVRPR